MTQQADTRSNFAQVKETIESVVIALILAFVFRAFVVEAFIIPTGSMAPTLYGAHIDHVCTNCGYSFAVGVGTIPVEVRCPNCDWIDPVVTEGQPPPLVDSGDRILVLKWPFALGGAFGPQRWDVVVFKAPFGSAASHDERDGQTNYIKRLIGLPGDVIEVVDGDVYVAPAEAIPEAIRAKLARTPLPAPLTAAEKEILNEKLRIARKPPVAQEALWQIVYDADYQPVRRETVAWRPLLGRSSWTVDGPVMHFAGPEVAEPQFVGLMGKDFRDGYGYNEGPGTRIVSDLRLKATVRWDGGDGSLLLCLSKYNDLYTVEISPRRGIGRTLRTSLLGQEAPQVLATWAFRSWRRGGTVLVSFANVDHRLEVRFDGEAVWQGGLGDSADTAAWALAQGYESQPPMVRIGAHGLTASLWHTAVHRDVYYRDDDYIRPQTPFGRTIRSEYSDQPAWAGRDNPMLLRQNEYFVMGDNSPQSYDSRLWWQMGQHLAERSAPYRVGTVPADQMIGQAFFVYWPSGYRIFGYGLPIVPNVGEMRWIH